MPKLPDLKPIVSLLGTAMKAAGGALKKFKKIRAAKKAAKKTPQGLSPAEFKKMSETLREGASKFGNDIAVHGSRANGTAKATSDIDVAIRVSKEKFDEIVKSRFKKPNPGSAKERTMLHAIKEGKIQRGELGLSGLGRKIEKQTGIKTDLSVILKGGPFDKGPYIPIK